MFNSVKSTLATLTALAAGCFIAAEAVKPASADAAAGYCYTTYRGADVCITRVRRIGVNTKRVWSVIDGRYDVDDVFCNPAHRYNYTQNMYGIACFEFS